jgi:hypothetical protein
MEFMTPSGITEITVKKQREEYQTWKISGGECPISAGSEA